MWSNTQNYSSSRVDELLEQATVELDKDRRKALYSEFQQIVTEELPVLWINVVSFHTVYNTGLRNLPISIWGLYSPLDELYWAEPPDRAYASVPTLEGEVTPVKEAGVRAIALLQEVGLYEARDALRDPQQGFLDLEGSGLHVIGFTREGTVFLDNSKQMKPGMDISGILDLEGNELLPLFLDAAEGENGGHVSSKGVWPHPGTHEVGPMSGWCGMLSDEDVICALEWNEGGTE
jgi:hypothetical protein